MLMDTNKNQRPGLNGWAFKLILKKDFMSDIVKEIPLKSGRKLQIIDDDNAESPREWDNLGTFACFHSRYDLGDKVDFSFNDFDGWDEMEEHIWKKEKAFACLPVYMYDHSGISLSVDPFNCLWDSGQVGFIYITKEKVKEEGYNAKQLKSYFKVYPDKAGKTIKEFIEDFLKNEIEVLDQYVSGKVYGFKLIDSPDNNFSEEEREIDSCWGFYGDDITKNGILDYLSEEDQPLNLNDL
jgi:hypothetical protein